MNLPNKITTFRMIMVVVILFLLAIPSGIGQMGPMIYFNQNHENGIYVIHLVACILFLIASFSDFLDGYLARKYNLVTTYGKFMDPIADKLLVDMILLFFALPMTTHGFGVTGQTGVPMLVCIIMIARDLIVDGIRLIAMEKKVVIAASWFGKTKTVLQMVALTFVLLNNWPFVYFGWNVNVTNLLCYVAGLVSLASGIDYLWKARHLFKGEER